MPLSKNRESLSDYEPVDSLYFLYNYRVITLLIPILFIK